MNGLLEQPVQQSGLVSTPPTPGVPTPGATPPVPGAAPPEAPPAVPENQAEDGKVDQKQLDIFVLNGLRLIHTGEVSDTITASIVQSKNPVLAIADATLNVVSKLEQSATDAQHKLSLSTIAYGANFIMGDIITSAEAAGLKKMSDEEKAKAYSIAVSKYLDNAVKTGAMPKEELVRLGKEAEESPTGQKVTKTAAKMAKGGPRNERIA